MEKGHNPEAVALPVRAPRLAALTNGRRGSDDGRRHPRRSARLTQRQVA
jgi:hypothetical protein